MCLRRSHGNNTIANIMWEKSVRPNLWNEKVPFNKILSDRFFLFFTIAQNIPLSVCVQNFRAPYRGRFEDNNVILLKTVRTSVCWRNFHLWKKYTRTNAHLNFKNCQFLLFYNTVLYIYFCFDWKYIKILLREHTRVVKVAPRPQTSCRKVYRVTLGSQRVTVKPTRYLFAFTSERYFIRIFVFNSIKHRYIIMG